MNCLFICWYLHSSKCPFHFICSWNLSRPFISPKCQKRGPIIYLVIEGRSLQDILHLPTLCLKWNISLKKGLNYGGPYNFGNSTQMSRFVFINSFDLGLKCLWGNVPLRHLSNEEILFMSAIKETNDWALIIWQIDNKNKKVILFLPFDWDHWHLLPKKYWIAYHLHHNWNYVPKN